MGGLGLLGLLVCLAPVFVLLWFGILVAQTLGRPPTVSSRQHLRNMARRWARWGLWAGICVLLVFFFVLPEVAVVREPARRSVCSSNLKQIGLAMQNYEAKHGCFPPAYLADKDGRPMHSWRVLLLPYLEYEDVFRQLRLDEAWDSPHNQAVLASAPAQPIFACPSDPNRRKRSDFWETNYVMIVGRGTISDGPHSVRASDITDGLDRTIMIVEVAGSGIHWAEPRDLKADEISYRINDPQRPGISSAHSGRANILFCDGSVRAVEDSTDPALIKAMTTIAGGEDVSEFFEEH